MSDLLEQESIDERALRAARQLRAVSSVRSLPEMSLPEPRRSAVFVSIAVIVFVVLGLVVIRTNRDDRTTGTGIDRFRWLVTNLPPGWKAQRVLEPYGPTERPPPRPSRSRTSMAPTPCLQVRSSRSPAPTAAPAQTSFRVRAGPTKRT